MFKTIKSKIATIMFLMLVVLCVAVSNLAFAVFDKGKKTKIESIDNKVSYFAEELNKIIGYFEERTEDLAVQGALFYNFSKNNTNFSNYIVEENFKSNKYASSGGVWFEPYKINPKQKRFSSFVYKKDKNFIFDSNSSSEKYDYQNKSWYKQIKKELLPPKTIVWVTPYKDHIGTHSLMTTAGAGIYDKDSQFIGLATVDWSLETIISKTSHLAPTKNSIVLFADRKHDYILITNDKNGGVGQPLKNIKWYNPRLQNGGRILYQGKYYACFVKELDNEMFLIVNVPEGELYSDAYLNLKIMLTLLILTCFSIALLTYFVLLYNINEPIKYLSKMATKIGEGNLDITLEIKKPEEFSKLAEILNKMKTDIKVYISEIDEAQNREKQIEFELKTANEIQKSILPCVFPPYPNRHEFDIYASMDSAKDVGGDFYDFFFINSKQFAFLIADVSGKGIPAALFMMQVKTVIKNFAKLGLSIEELVFNINNSICKNNTKCLFVTMFIGIIDLETSSLHLINAGHNPPLIKTNNDFEYIKCPQNIVLGAKENVSFETSEICLKGNDTIFLYTDGITESRNNQGLEFGEEALLNSLNQNKNKPLKEILDSVKLEVKEFANTNIPFDDITMLILKYNPFEKLILTADVKFLPDLIKNIENFYKKTQLSEKQILNFKIAAEEIFVNIANYSYTNKEAKVEIKFEISEQSALITFCDKGAPFNPLEVCQADIDSPIETRKIGGLGIHMAKNLLDSMEYKYKDGSNILALGIKV